MFLFWFLEPGTDSRCSLWCLLCVVTWKLPDWKYFPSCKNISQLWKIFAAPLCPSCAGDVSGVQQVSWRRWAVWQQELSPHQMLPSLTPHVTTPALTHTDNKERPWQCVCSRGPSWSHTLYPSFQTITMMSVGEVRIAEDSDFALLKVNRCFLHYYYHQISL